MSRNIFGYNSKIPENIREIFMWICQDVASLQNKWSFYLGLFTNEEKVTLLSELAQSSFQIIEESLRNDMTMVICRLSDPPQSRGNDNLSFSALIQKCGRVDSAPALLKEFQDACLPVRKYRDKRVAHNDLNTTIKSRDNPLPGIGRSQIDRIVQLASVILNSIYQRFVDNELSFMPLQIGGADTLIYWLRMAKEYEAAKNIALKKSAG